VKITTTISKKLHELAKNRGIPWSRALEVGVRHLADLPPIVTLQGGQQIQGDPYEIINRKEKQKTLLEQEIEKLLKGRKKYE